MGEWVSREPMDFPLSSNTHPRQGTQDNHFCSMLEAVVAEADYSQK